MRGLILIAWVVLVATSVLTSATADESLKISRDGWHTWQVDEPGVSSEMCCFTWSRRDGGRKGCNLDASSIAFSDGDDCGVTAGTIQVFVRVKNGVPKDIRVLSSNCPVTTESEISDHGLVSVAENIGWFRTIIEDRSLRQDVREEALFGLVQSQSDAAYSYIDSLLTSR